VKILAIRFARLGDVVLLLPALASLKRSFPAAELTLLTGHRCAPLAELCPAIDEVLSVDRVAMRDGSVFKALGDMLRVVRDVRRRKFDLVVDFHSFRETNLLAWISGAPARVAMKRYRAPYLRFCFSKPPVLEDKSLHVADMFQRVAEAVGGKLGSAAPPSLDVPLRLKDWAKSAAPQTARLALYIDAPVPERIWPPERFARVADFAIEAFNATVLVISGNSGSTLAQRVQKASRYPGRLSLFADVTIPQLASLIASAQLLVSNDTGPMHLGPAVGVLTLGLFSVGYPEHFRPIGPDDRFLRGNPIEKIQETEVIELVRGMWAIADRDLRR
jgi:ADP-heptose:LPS heptosyltransferase